MECCSPTYVGLESSRKKNEESGAQRSPSRGPTGIEHALLLYRMNNTRIRKISRLNKLGGRNR